MPRIALRVPRRAPSLAGSTRTLGSRSAGPRGRTLLVRQESDHSTLFFEPVHFPAIQSHGRHPKNLALSAIGLWHHCGARSLQLRATPSPSAESCWLRFCARHKIAGAEPVGDEACARRASPRSNACHLSATKNRRRLVGRAPEEASKSEFVILSSACEQRISLSLPERFFGYIVNPLRMTHGSLRPRVARLLIGSPAKADIGAGL